MQGKMVQVNWQDDEATLKGWYVSEKNSTLKVRLHLLWLVRQGKPVQEAAALVGAHKRSAQRWLALYRGGGISAVRAHTMGNPVGRDCRLSAEQQAQLDKQATEEGFSSGLAVQKWIQDTFGVVYTQKGVYELLSRLGIKKKVPRPMNVKAEEEAQDAFKKGA